MQNGMTSQTRTIFEQFSAVEDALLNHVKMVARITAGEPCVITNPRKLNRAMMTEIVEIMGQAPLDNVQAIKRPKNLFGASVVKELLGQVKKAVDGYTSAVNEEFLKPGRRFRFEAEEEKAGPVLASLRHIYAGRPEKSKSKTVKSATAKVA